MSTRWFIFLSVVLAGLDQLSKFLARRLVDYGTLMDMLSDGSNGVYLKQNNIIPDFYNLTLTFNPGIAWGMLPHWSEYFTYFAIIMVLVILMIMRKLGKDEVWFKIALSFQMAGAFGNMTDRLLFKKVTDFIDVTLFPNADVHYQWGMFGRTFNFDLPYEWPIFNLADSFVVVGTVVLVAVLFFAKEPVIEKEPVQEEVSGQLAGLPGAETEGIVTGVVPEEEGLVEIPPDSGSEMLAQFEDADTVKTDFLGGISEPYRRGLSADAADPDDEDKLDDLSRRPEKND